MAYETGASSSPTDLLDKLRVFLSTNGWTIDKWAVLGNGYELHVHKGTIYNHFRSYHGDTLSSTLDINGQTSANFWGIGGYGSDGFNGSLGWATQPGYPAYGSGGACRGGYMVDLTAASPAYHFFCYPDIDEIHVVLEFVAGRFQYMGFGKLDLYNASAAGGGRWFSMPTYSKTYLPKAEGYEWSQGAASMIPFRASWYAGSGTVSCSTFVRVNIDNHDGWAGEAPSASLSPSPIAAVGGGHWDSDIEAYVMSPYNWQTILLPYKVGIVRLGDISVSPLGEIKHMRRTDITNYLPGEEFAFGSDTWKVFPLYQKNGYSLSKAFAIRKVV